MRIAGYCYKDDDFAEFEVTKEGAKRPWEVESGEAMPDGGPFHQETLLVRVLTAGIAALLFTVLVFIVMAAIGFAFGVGWIAAEGLLK